MTTKTITETQVAELRNAYTSGVKQSELAKRFRIGQAQVSRIVNHVRRK